jgi:hypothetical protein
MVEPASSDSVVKLEPTRQGFSQQIMPGIQLIRCDHLPAIHSSVASPSHPSPD